MSTVVVTGGSGHAGWPVVEHLQAEGHRVLSVDRVPPPGRADYRLVNLEDLGQVYGSLAGADAVVHLAAIPRPIYHTPDVVFRTNMLSMFNVLEAAYTLGIPRLVFGSSVSVLGFPFFTRPLAPVYAPIDEDHPRLPQDAYGISKLLGEEMIDAFVRRGGPSVVSLRMPWIHTPASFRQFITPLQQDLTLPDGPTNLWGYIDTRDVARAVQRALEVTLAGHEAMFIAAPDTFMPQPTRELLAQFYPATELRAPYAGREGLLSTAKAERVLGWKAEHTWAEY